MNTEIKGCGESAIDHDYDYENCGEEDDGLCPSCQSKYQERANCLNDELVRRLNFKQKLIDWDIGGLIKDDNTDAIDYLQSQLKALKEAGFEGK